MADKKEVVEFPENKEYLERIRQAQAGAPPLGGAPMPQMPRFDMPPEDRHQGVQRPMMPASGIIPPEQRAELERQGALIPGVGSAYVANQPAMQRQAPQASQGKTEWQNPPRPEGAGLRPETAKQLEEVAKANAEGKKADKEAADLKEEMDKLDEEFDYDEFGNKIHTLTQNKQRREAIEARCAPMDFAQLITIQEVRQDVPIIPGKFVPTFRSAQGHEELYIKKKMSGERGSEAYLRDKFALLALALGLYALNGRELPSHLDKDGEVDDELFSKKLKILLRFPFDLLADMSTNLGWFGKRVQKLLVVDNIKGF